MKMQVVGNGPNAETFAQVDPSFQALRTSVKPAEWQATGSAVQGGHYRVGFMGAALAGALVAPNEILSVRWADPARVCVVERLSLGVLWSAVSSPVDLDLSLYRATNFTANSSGSGSTTPTPAKARGNMPASQFLNAGELRVHGTAALTAGTHTLDTSPSAYWIAQPQIGFGTAAVAGLHFAPIFDVWRRVDLGNHPEVFAANEGFVVRLESIALAASNSIKLVGIMEWYETAVF